jgi:hypothetical protein
MSIHTITLYLCGIILHLKGSYSCIWFIYMRRFEVYLHWSWRVISVGGCYSCDSTSLFAQKALGRYSTNPRATAFQPGNCYWPILAPDVALPLTGRYKEIRYKSWEIYVAGTDIHVCSGFNLSFSGMMLATEEEHQWSATCVELVKFSRFYVCSY